jgi:hypothetical protein
MRPTVIFTISLFLVMAIAAYAIAHLSVEVGTLRTQRSELAERIERESAELSRLTQLSAEVRALREQLTALEERLERQPPDVTMSDSITDVTTFGSPTTSSGVAAPAPPFGTTAGTPEAQSHLDAWTTEYCQAVLALDRRDSLRRIAKDIAKDAGWSSSWAKSMMGQAAGDEVSARTAIRRAETEKANFEAANK